MLMTVVVLRLVMLEKPLALRRLEMRRWMLVLGLLLPLLLLVMGLAHLHLLFFIPLRPRLRRRVQDTCKSLRDNQKKDSERGTLTWNPRSLALDILSAVPVLVQQQQRRLYSRPGHTCIHQWHQLQTSGMDR